MKDSLKAVLVIPNTARNSIEYVYGEQGWEAKIPQQLQPKVEFDVIVAHRDKHWLDNFDLTNKSLFPEYKWDWFEDNASGDNVLGSMPGGNLDTGNPMGKNSHIYNSYQGDDFISGGGGARIPFMKHLPNALSYLKKGLRDVNDVMEHYNNLSSGFGNNTQMKLDNISRDSIFQNEITPFSGRYEHHYNPPYGNQPDSTLQFGRKDYLPKRKDSLKMIIMIRKKMDSLDNRYNK